MKYAFIQKHVSQHGVCTPVQCAWRLHAELRDEGIAVGVTVWRG